MDNKQIARILRDTAQLLEIDGAIIGRYRSYEKAAELIDSLPESVEQLVKEPEKLEELPDIASKIGMELRNQYVVGYHPSNKAHDARWRKVKIKLRAPRGLPPLTVYSKTGYYAPSH